MLADGHAEVGQPEAPFPATSRGKTAGNADRGVPRHQPPSKWLAARKQRDARSAERAVGGVIEAYAFDACQTRRVPSYDSALDAANAAKKTAVLLRDARGVQRRLDKLAVGMADATAPAQRSLSEARDAVARVIAELVHEEHAQRRATQQALLRRRG